MKDCERRMEAVGGKERGRRRLDELFSRREKDDDGDEGDVGVEKPDSSGRTMDGWKAGGRTDGE